MAVDNTGKGTPTGTIREAATAFEALLTLEEGNQSDDEAKPQVEEAEQADESEGVASETDETTDEVEQDVEGEQSGDEEDDEQKPGDKLYTVRVDGKEEQVPESELLAGYQRQRDYTQKTQALASERKAIAQEQAQLRQQRSEYAELLPKLRSVLEADLTEPNWEELRATDPVQAAIAKDRFDERKAKIQAVRAEEERIRSQNEQEQAALRNQILIEEQQKLLARPELAHWKDPAKASADTKLIVETMKNAGFADEELQIFDHRAMVIALKAAKYDELMQQRTAAQGAVKGKVAKAPVATPGSAVRKSGSALQKDQARLARSGSVRDAARIFERLID